jgi:hypothetical protein
LLLSPKKSEALLIRPTLSEKTARKYVPNAGPPPEAAAAAAAPTCFPTERKKPAARRRATSWAEGRSAPRAAPRAAHGCGWAAVGRAGLLKEVEESTLDLSAGGVGEADVLVVPAAFGAPAAALGVAARALERGERGLDDRPQAGGLRRGDALRGAAAGAAAAVGGGVVVATAFTGREDTPRLSGSPVVIAVAVAASVSASADTASAAAAAAAKRGAA